MTFPLANLLSLSRMICALPSAYAVMAGEWVIASMLFIAAIVTDLSDGYVARRNNQVTSLGGLLDHSSDALFVAMTLAGFAFIGSLPLLLPILVIASFGQYVLDSRALQGQSLRASLLGRWNGVAYFVLAGIALGTELLRVDWTQPIIEPLAWVLVASTIVSMLDRLIALIRSIRSAA